MIKWVELASWDGERTLKIHAFKKTDNGFNRSLCGKISQDNDGDNKSALFDQVIGLEGFELQKACLNCMKIYEKIR